MRFLPLAFLLAACGEAGPPPPQPEPQPNAQVRAAPAPPSATPPRRDPGGSVGDPAATLKRYFALIDAGALDQAWKMRSGDAAGFERFRAAFQGYESYRATVGVPTEPVESGGWLYVEVPVMITGRKRGGEPFGTAGSVSLRRAATGNADADGHQREWHIFTG